MYLEYLMGDVYRRYGYDFQYYDGAPMDEEAMNALVGRLHGCTDLILASYKKAMEHKVFFEGEDPEQRRQEILTEIGENMAAKRREIAGVLMRGLRFVNKKRRAAELHAPFGAGPGAAGTAAVSLRRRTWNTREPYTFFTGLSGAGKTTVGSLFYQRLKKHQAQCGLSGRGRNPGGLRRGCGLHQR